MFRVNTISYLSVLLCFLFPLLGSSGELSRADIEHRVLPPLYVGEPSDDLPIWPIFSRLEPDSGPVGYVFETIDFAPLPGFEGKPMNMLVWLDRRAQFVTVEVISQREPVFVHGFGPERIDNFVRQYAGQSLRDRFTVASAYGGDRSGGSGQVILDGVTRATVSVQIANQTVIEAALAVARARLGFAPTATVDRIAKVRTEHFERLELDQLLEQGYVARLRLSNQEVEALFADSNGAGLDREALRQPDELFIEWYVAYLNAPTIGRSLLGDDGFERAMRRARDGQHLYWVGWRGRYSVLDEDFVAGTVPSRLRLTQNEAPIELHDADAHLSLSPPIPGLEQARVFDVAPNAGLDPASPVTLTLEVRRLRGQIYPEVIERPVPLVYAPPPELFEYPPKPLPDWLLGWRERSTDLALIGASLMLLCVVLARPRKLARNPRVLQRFRLLFMAFTLGYIGWYAQAQLSIVHLTGAIKSLASGQGLWNYLYDPVILLLIAFTVVTFFIWGRGTFCGWLCPFGAMQEFVALIARRLGIRQRRLPPKLATALARSRFPILAVLLVLAATAPQVSEMLVEIEPFKTAITANFIRSWPFVVYCLLLLVAGIFVYKFFCRYLCPLGAALTVGGRLRLPDWLARRAECGTPCQTCRSRCEYDAIARDGRIRYDDCFQCLDCVGIYYDDRRCAPLVLYRRKGKIMTPRGAVAAPAPAIGAPGD